MVHLYVNIKEDLLELIWLNQSIEKLQSWGKIYKWRPRLQKNRNDLLSKKRIALANVDKPASIFCPTRDV